MKNGDMNNNPMGIMIIALLFIIIAGAGIPVVIMQKANVWWIVLCVVLLAVGILFLVFATMRFIMISKMNKVLDDDSAYVTDAKFISSKASGYTSHAVNNVTTDRNVYYTIRYSYVDETGCAQEVKSILSYKADQVENLKSQGTFKIKCKGKISGILGL